MAQPIYYLTSTGNGISPDGTLPAGAVACTQAQYAAASSWTAQDGAIVAVTPPAPTLAQRAMAMLATGFAVVSEQTSSLNASYPCDQTTQSHVVAEMLAIQVTGKFADGTTTLVWLDSSGNQHTFPSTADFQAFAVAQAAFIANCLKVISGTSTTLPSGSASIP